MGPAHSTNDVGVWLPEQKVMFAGDLAFSGGHPIFLEGSMPGFRGATAADARRSSPRCCCPATARSAAATRSAGSSTTSRRTSTGSRQLATESYAAGLTPLEAAQKAPQDGPYRDLPEGERVVCNLHRAYVELTDYEPPVPLNIPSLWPEMVALNGGADREPRMSVPRRVVTGHTADGVSVVLSDGPVPVCRSAARRRRGVPRDLEHRGRPGPDHRRRADEPTERTLAVPPPPRGTKIRINEFAPGHLDERGLQSPVHRTASVDYGIVLEGEITLVLDDSEVTLARRRHRRAARHRPRLGQPRRDRARVVFVLVDGEFDDDSRRARCPVASTASCTAARGTDPCRSVRLRPAGAEPRSASA